MDREGRAIGTGEDLARLEARLVELFDEGQEPRSAELRREFPALDQAVIERKLRAAAIVHDWLRGRAEESDGHAARPDTSWLQPGERIGGYQVLRRIRGGGMGQVYQVVQESLYPRQVALKVLRLGEHPEQELQAARAEAEVASRLVHPNLAAVHDMGHDPGRGLAWFSMQFVDGPDLRAALLEGEPPRDRAAIRRLVTRISEVAGALGELHARGLVHRDVKPENILLRRNGGRDGKSEAAVLVDFGLARAERALRRPADSAPAAGTPGYAPPEAERTGVALTPAWDVYSLGVVLYELLRGRALARAASGTPAERPATDPHALRAALPGADPDLAAVVRVATRPDPRERYRDATLLQRDLERWLAADYVSARRPPHPERVVRAVRKHPARALVTALAIPLLLTATLVVAAQVRQVRSGLAAIERGELFEGWEKLATAHPLFLRTLVPDKTLRRDLIQGTQDTPVARVVAAKREHGLPRAFDTAAAFLQRDGLHEEGRPNHPELQALLLRNIDEHPGSLVGAHPSALRSVAQLFYESPVEDTKTQAIAIPYRERALALLVDQNGSRKEHLYAASLLGGCGTPRDLEALLDWIEGYTADDEISRIGMFSFSRVVGRARKVARADELSASEWSQLESRLLTLAEVKLHPWIERDPNPLMAVLCTWALLHRTTGHATAIRSTQQITGFWWVDLEIQLALYGITVPMLRKQLALGLDLYNQREWFLADPTRVDLLGRACAYAEDPYLRIRIESALVHDAESLKWFTLGWKSGLEALNSGRLVQFHPDEHSRLLKLIVTPDPETVEVLEETQGSDPSVLALWRFRPTKERSGWALDAALRAGAVWDPGWTESDRFGENNPPHLRLRSPGASLSLPFQVPADPQLLQAILVLAHEAAQRPYLAFGGQSWVRIELDNDTLAERLAAGRGAHESSFFLDYTLLPPGEHTLTITLVESTTTYWIREVRLERPPR